SQDSEFSNADQMDLYDDVLAASSQPPESRTSSSEAPPEIRQEPSPKPHNKSPAILYTYSGLRNKRAAVYVGSFSWWTTDQQLIQTIRSVGVYDVVELKFAENRANGQSKGYAEVVVASENSVHKLLELLPGKILNGDKVEVRLATRQNLSQFEAQARKRDDVTPQPRAGGLCGAAGTVLAGACTRRSWPAVVIVEPVARFTQGKPFFRSALAELQWGSCDLRTLPSARSHLAAWQRHALLDRSPARPRVSAEQGVFPSPTPCLAGHGEAEFRPAPRGLATGTAELTLAPLPPLPTQGDYSDAIETLLTAIAVIKQSRVANDERCRVLLSSLKDCLHGIEAKSYSTGASSSSSRKRHRSRERSPSRSRESSRRHRDLLHSEDRHEDYFQERNREHERHRDRDRERDR
ncbi:Cleavage and polyadenylation specificity factor subunit 7, partial [Egretta garzetta]